MFVCACMNFCPATIMGLSVCVCICMGYEFGVQNLENHTLKGFMMAFSHFNLKVSFCLNLSYKPQI